MATDLGRAKAAAAGKHDAYVAAQLARAEGRIRALDLTAGLLGFVGATLAYAVLMAVCDRSFDLTPAARQAALAVYLVAAAVYLAFAVVRPLRRRVNPYYAARQVEQTLPGAKNSVVNWVDLHGEALPPAVLGAVGQRAARDLARADLDKAISGRRTGWVGTITAACVVTFLVLLLAWGSGPFFYRLARAFNPFTSAGPAPTRTRLTLLRPENGNTTVTIGRAVTVAVRAEGQVPGPKDADALKLLYRHQQADPWIERLLQKEPGDEWSATVSSIEVQNGFSYKVTGGDAETPEYRVSVRTAPLITDFEAAYHFRPYVGRIDEVRRDRKLEALRGTEVTLRVRTNRTIKNARLDFEGREGGKSVVAERVADDPESFRVRLVLDESGQYRLHFTSAEGEPYTETTFSPLVAIPDRPPRADLTQPGQDIALPANGLLRLEGKVTDDIGIKSVLLRLEVVGALKLKERPYRSEDKLRLAGGGYPVALDYKDFVDLAGVRKEDGKPFALRPGMEVEYWLEARDACDYPKPGGNVGASKHFRVKIVEPKPDPQQKQQKQEAQKDQQRHEQKQDEKLKQENEQRQQERKEQEQRQKDEARRREQQRKQQAGKRGEKDKPKPGDSKDGGEKNSQDGAKGKPGDDRNGKPKDQKPGEGKQDREQQEKDRQTLEKAERLRQQAEKFDKDRARDGKDAGTQDSKPGREGTADKQPDKKPGDPKDTKPASSKKPDDPTKGRDTKSGESRSEDSKPGREGTGAKQSDKKPGDPKDTKPSDVKRPGKPGESTKGRDTKPGDPGSHDTKPMSDPASPGNRRKPDEARPQTGDPKAGKEPAGKPDTKPKAGDPTTGTKKPDYPKAPRPAGTDPKDTTVKPPRTGGEDTKPKPAGPDKPKNGSTTPRGKDDPPKGKKPDDKHGTGTEKVPDKKPGSEPKDATPQDVSEVAKDLKCKDGRCGQAKRSLEKIREEARDPKTREAARKALDEHRRREKEEQRNSDGKPGEPKPPKGPPRDGKEPGKGGKDTKPGDPPKGDPKDGKGKPTDKDPAKPRGGEPNLGLDGKPPAGGSTKPDRRDQPPRHPQTPAEHRASMMQLERLADKVRKADPKALQELGMSEKERQDLLKALHDMKDREQAAAEKENVTGPQRTSPLKSMGGRTIKPGTQRGNDLGGDGRGRPPLGYRNAYEQFQKQLRESEKDKK